jgi:putative tryptophan/tyrosine transport system substrate-binding protein
MRRREFITGLGALAWPMPLRAQQAAKSHRVGYLALVAGPDSTVIKERLSELGYAEGKNLIFDFLSAEGRSVRLPELAAELVRTGPEVIVAGTGTLTAKTLQAATASIPIVFVTVGDPLGAGLVNSLNRPGANITGVTSQAGEVSSKRLQILVDLIPNTRIIAVIRNPETPFTDLALQELKVASETRAQHLAVFDIRTADQLPTSIEAALRAGATALMTLEDPLLLSLRRQIVELVAKARLPTLYGNRDFTDAGGLLSYGANPRQNYRRAAEIVAKVLKGEKPADIPVEQSTRFELVINLKTANALGLTIPETLLATADEVIQ